MSEVEMASRSTLYTTDILRLAASLAGPRRLERVDGSAELRSPTCGSTVEVQVQLDPDGRVEALSQKVHACAFGQASAALVETSAGGRGSDEIIAAIDQLGDWLTDERREPPDWPGYAALAPARSRGSRHGAILLPLRALAAAMATAR